MTRTSPEDKPSTQEIFLQALDVSAEGRLAFLETACRGNAELRREVESLLQHHRPETLVGAPLIAREQTPGLAAGVTSAVAVAASNVFGGTARRAVAWVLAAVLIGGVGYWTREKVQESLQNGMREILRTVLDADVMALETWISSWKREANTWAGSPTVRAYAERLVRKAGGDPEKARKARGSSELDEFVALLRPFLDEAPPGEADFVLSDREGLRVATTRPQEGLGRRNTERAAGFLVPVLAGQTRFSPPSRADAWSADRPKDPRSMVFVAVPVRDSSQKVIAVLLLLKLVRSGFPGILNAGRMGSTGETYAISSEGLMLSPSRFDDTLKKVGLVPNEPDASSVLTVQVRDPGGDLTQGYKPALELDARPLTMAASLAIASRGKPPDQQTGVVLTPYRNYQGVEVVGAWRWLPEHDFGVITEVEAAIPFAASRYVGRAFEVLFALLGVFIGLTLLTSISLARVRQREPRLGQYTLLKQIGEGGSSKVYLARHALLRRPTAVKVLKVSDEMPRDAIQRFEREVQAVSRLTHPNTIEIYDFGRSLDGAFYYAMEYLPGLNLAELVALEGPVPAGRVIHILKQVCASLREAHELGLVHRDIKPLNIMLCERGGEYDFVKVLDFGLVRNLGDAATLDITAPHRVVGTPLYMAPERFSRPLEADVRSDIYSLGAVAYHLLSGRPVFQSLTDLDLLGQVLHAEPDRLSGPIPPELERLVMDCLAKDPAARPQSVAVLLEALQSIPNVTPWTQREAKAWWVRRAPGLLHARTDKPQEGPTGQHAVA